MNSDFYPSITPGANTGGPAGNTTTPQNPATARTVRNGEPEFESLIHGRAPRRRAEETDGAESWAWPGVGPGVMPLPLEATAAEQSELQPMDGQQAVASGPAGSGLTEMSLAAQSIAPAGSTRVTEMFRSTAAGESPATAAATPSEAARALGSGPANLADESSASVIRESNSLAQVVASRPAGGRAAANAGGMDAAAKAAGEFLGSAGQVEWMEAGTAMELAGRRSESPIDPASLNSSIDPFQATSSTTWRADPAASQLAATAAGKLALAESSRVPAEDVALKFELTPGFDAPVLEPTQSAPGAGEGATHPTVDPSTKWADEGRARNLLDVGQGIGRSRGEPLEIETAAGATADPAAATEGEAHRSLRSEDGDSIPLRFSTAQPAAGASEASSSSMMLQTQTSALSIGTAMPFSTEPSPAAPTAVTLAAAPQRIAAETLQLVRSGGVAASIDLDPPDLGRLRLHIAVHSGVVRASIEVEQALVMHALEADQATLMAALSERGIVCEQLDIRMFDPRRGSERQDTRRGSSKGKDSIPKHEAFEEAGAPGESSRLLDYWW